MSPRFSQGARVRSYGQVRRVVTPDRPKPVEAPAVHKQAYELAMANKHKSWARRWLRANGKWA